MESCEFEVADDLLGMLVGLAELRQGQRVRGAALLIDGVEDSAAKSLGLA